MEINGEISLSLHDYKKSNENSCISQNVSCIMLAIWLYIDDLM